MEIIKAKSSSNLSLAQPSTNSNQKSKKILTEEEYTEKMEKIITRDFFPDLPKLKAQNAYLDAVEKGDVAKMQEIQLAYPLTQSRANSVRDTGCIPSSFATPEVQPMGSPSCVPSEMDDTISIVNGGEVKARTLDQFLSQATSEDNVSFQAIMVKTDAVHQQKYPWLYKDEHKLSLTDSVAPLTWAYKNKNALMYVPDGAELTAEEKSNYEANRKEIVHQNTRFEAPPFDEEANQEAIAEAASLQAKMKEGRVGIDGKELNPDESPQVNGYGFVGTPLPDPGVSATPIMTWGEIEGTPFRLDGGDTPLPQNPGGQQFKMPGPSARERIAHSLADQAAQKHRKINKKIAKSFSFGSTPPRSALERLHNMSPAAQKLACAQLGIQRNSDRALRASYSPLHSPATPLTPTPTHVTPKHVTPVVLTPSQTEVLLSLPKRRKASDFF